MQTNEMVQPAHKLRGSPVIPGDKSISHRGLIFGALAKGRTEIKDILESADIHSTAQCLQRMGVPITRKGSLTLVEGRGNQGLLAPSSVLDCGNSGTTIRILMGVLAGQRLEATLIGDESLQRRPMKRVAEPLTAMGAKIALTKGDFAPLTIVGAPLHAIDYQLKVASAQIKTAIIMAALSAQGTTRLTGEIQSRDHTERMLKDFGVHLDVTPHLIQVQGGQPLKACTVQVPGDPSTAAFWMAAASMIPDSHLQLENISLNPTRLGFLRALQRMGAEIKVELTSEQSEPVGRIRVSGSKLRGVHIPREEVPSLIDEVPLLAVVATQAKGETIIEGAEELRVKESDRLEAVASNLRKMGAEIEVRPDGFRIEGQQQLHGARLPSFHDHRIAMAFSIAALVAQGPSEIENAECAGISYPGFFTTLRELTR